MTCRFTLTHRVLPQGAKFPYVRHSEQSSEIPREDVPFAPLPLRSCDFLRGLPGLCGIELKRVELAKKLFRYTCHLFSLCVLRGKLATMENPRGSCYFFPPNAFMASARSFNMFQSMLQLGLMN